MPTVSVTAVPQPVGTVSLSIPGPVVPNLQQVTHRGAATTDVIVAAGFVGDLTGTATTISGSIAESQVSGLPAALAALQASLVVVQGEVATAAQASVVQALQATVQALQQTVETLPVPTLQSVTDAGATTTDVIHAAGFVGPLSFPNGSVILQGDSGGDGGLFIIDADGNSLQWSGGLTVNADATMEGYFGVSLDSDFLGDVDVEGNARFHSMLMAGGNAMVGGSLNVVGGATISGLSTFGGDTAILGNLKIQGGSILGSYDAKIDISDYYDVHLPNGGLTVTGDVTAAHFIGDGSQLTNLPTGAAPTLQSVTDAGATTTDTITVGSLSLFASTGTPSVLSSDGNGNVVVGGGVTANGPMTVDAGATTPVYRGSIVVGTDRHGNRASSVGTVDIGQTQDDSPVLVLRQNGDNSTFHYPNLLEFWDHNGQRSTYFDLAGTPHFQNGFSIPYPANGQSDSIVSIAGWGVGNFLSTTVYRDHDNNLLLFNGTGVSKASVGGDQTPFRINYPLPANQSVVTGGVAIYYGTTSEVWSVDGSGNTTLTGNATIGGSLDVVGGATVNGALHVPGGGIYADVYGNVTIYTDANNQTHLCAGYAGAVITLDAGHGVTMVGGGVLNMNGGNIANAGTLSAAGATMTGNATIGGSLNVVGEATVGGLTSNGPVIYNGTAIDGVSFGTGFVASLGHNQPNNKQFWLGDPDYSGSTSGYFARFVAHNGQVTIDAVRGDGTTYGTLTLGDPGQAASQVVLGNSTVQGSFATTGNAMIGGSLNVVDGLTANGTSTFNGGLSVAAQGDPSRFGGFYYDSSLDATVIYSVHDKVEWRPLCLQGQDGNSGNVVVGNSSDNGSGARLQVTGGMTATGNVMLGSDVVQGLSQVHNVSFGCDYGLNAPGSANNLKWIMFGPQGDGADQYGIGMSASLMEIRTGAGADIGFFPNGGVEAMRVKASGNVLIGTTTDNGTDRLQVDGSVLAAGGIITNVFRFASGAFLSCDDGETLYFTSVNGDTQVVAQDNA